jgi:hypothetical protein
MVDINAGYQKKNTVKDRKGPNWGTGLATPNCSLLRWAQFFVPVCLNIVTHVKIDFWSGTGPDGATLKRFRKVCWIAITEQKSRPRRQTHAPHWLFQRIWWQTDSERGREQNFRSTALEWDHSRPITTPTAWMARISKKEIMLPHLVLFFARPNDFNGKKPIICKLFLTVGLRTCL